MIYLKNKLFNFLEERVALPLMKSLQRQSDFLIKNIGANRNGPGAPRALVIYVSTSIPYYMSGNVYACPIIDSHAMYWESAEIVNVLVNHGFVVDFINCFKPIPEIAWEKYKLVVDEGNNLINAPDVPGQVRAFYCTGLPWDFHNAAELRRHKEFYERNGVLLNPQRIVRPNFSDQKSNYIFCFAYKEWMELFSPIPVRQPITTSVTFVPDKIERDYSKREFLWLGSHGPIHKGLDLLVEAFRELPGVRLNVFGPITADLLFFSWLVKEIRANPNIVFHDTATISDIHFQSVVKNCVAHIFPSCSEGGAGSVAQTSHFGLVPVVTHTANALSGQLGFTIRSLDTRQIIIEIQEHVRNILELSEIEIAQKSDSLIEFARKTHTREVYSRLFTEFVRQLK